MNTQKTTPVFTTANATFTVVAVYQYRENYGAHAWNGEGECPQYWKNKGGHEEVVADDITQAMLDDRQFMARLQELAYQHAVCDDYSEYHFMGFEVVNTALWLGDSLVPDPYADTFWNPDHHDYWNFDHLAQGQYEGTEVHEPWERFEMLAEHAGH